MRHPLLRAVPILTLAVGCGGEGAGVSTPPPPAPKVVADVTISLPASVLVKGDTARVQATLRDVNGAEITGRPISWSSSAADIASVSADGLVQALAAGITTINATSEGKSGTLTLTVARSLAVTNADSLLAPGETFTLRGDGLRSARVSIAGTDALVVDATDSSLAVTVPAEPWSPCVGPGARLPVSVTSGRQKIDLTRAALERPKVVDLAISAYLDVPTEVLGRECRLQLPTSGTYLVLPFVPVRADASPAPASDSIAVVVRVDDATSPSASVAPVSLPRRQRSFAGLMSLTAGARGGLPSDVVRRPLRAVAALPCALPPLGGTVPVRSTRDSIGRLTWVGAGSTEQWANVAQGQSIAVFADSATLRMAQADQQWAMAFNELVAISDTSIVPFLNAYTRGFPDNDQNGKLIVYATGSGYGLPSFAINETMRTDCPSGGGGEAIVLNLSFGPDFPPYVDYSVLSHEMGHIVDYAWNERTSASSWGVEGFASFLQNLYRVRSAPDPLAANLSTLQVGFHGSGIDCVAVTPLEALTEGLYSVSWDYGIGCSMVGYLIALYREQNGGTIKDAITAWSRVPNTRTMEDVDSYFGVSRGASRSFGHWLLSWYADDYIAGIPPELRQPLWDIRQIWTNDLVWRSGYPLPDVTLSASVPSASFRLGAPDARYVELVAPKDAMLSVTRSGRVPTDVSLIVFRAR